MKITLYGLARKSIGRVSIEIDWESINNDILRAGTPLSADGQISNDERCIGIVANDCVPYYNGVAEVIVAGEVDRAEQQSISGIKLSKEAISAMSNIRFTNDEKYLSLLKKA